MALLNENAYDRRTVKAVYKQDGTRGHHMQVGPECCLSTTLPSGTPNVLLAGNQVFQLLHTCSWLHPGFCHAAFVRLRPSSCTCSTILLHFQGVHPICSTWGGVWHLRSVALADLCCIRRTLIPELCLCDESHQSICAAPAGLHPSGGVGQGAGQVRQCC